MPHVAVYLRISTLDQEKGIKSQEHAIRKYLEGHGFKNVKWYRDRVSGAATKMPQLDRLERDIFYGQVNVVVVWALDRLSRKGARDGLNLIGKWLDKGVRIVSLTEQFDFSNEIGETIAAFCFSIARMYRTRLIENTKRGMAKAKADGKKFGRRPTLFATDIRKLREQGLSMTEVATRLKSTRQGIYKALKREQAIASLTSQRAS